MGPSRERRGQSARDEERDRERDREREAKRERERHKDREGERVRERERARNRDNGEVRGGDAAGYWRDDNGRKDTGRDAHGRHRDCYGDSQGTKKSPNLKRNIAIYKQIMRAQGASELCTLIETRVAEFNHVNVSTAFRTLLQSRRDGGPRGVVERALQALEAAALRTIDAFGAQHVSNTLHIMAKSRYRPWDRTLIPELEGRAEALAGTFNAQNVANTLWAYATWGGSPGQG